MSVHSPGRTASLSVSVIKYPELLSRADKYHFIDDIPWILCYYFTKIRTPCIIALKNMPAEHDLHHMNRLLTAIKHILPETIKKPLRLLRYRSEDNHTYHRMTQRWPVLRQYSDFTKQFMIKTAEQRGFGSLDAYDRYLENHEEERKWLESHFTYTGSHFFRGEDWSYFRDECLSQFKDSEHIRIWCAACSSGQEVYSLILCLLDYVPLEALEILATDYNDELLAKTAAGSYFMSHYHEIPEQYRKYTDHDEKRFVFHEELRNRIVTRHLNLLEDPYPSGFDIILCRNVVKFFSPEARAAVQASLAGSLNPGGYLFLSKEENSNEFIQDPDHLNLEQCENRTIYRKR